MTKPPVVFFAFANDREVGGVFLPSLAEEERRVRAALDQARRAGRCQVEIRCNATADVIWNVFLDDEFRGRIAVFHFAGHAGDGEILLENRDGMPAAAYAEGLAGFLGTQKGLGLVFLNGCSTETHVQALLAARVPAVIATSEEIGDEMATDFAAWFYKSLGAEADLETAFKNAEYCIRSQEKDGTARVPWGLHLAEDGKDQLKGWKLSGAATSATTRRTAGGIPDIPELLPYLCDRRDQEDQLDIAVTAHRKSQNPRRPLAVLIHGDYQEALERFADRLLDLTLPRFLGRAPLVRKGPLIFNDSDRGGLEERLGLLRRNLAEKLCGGDRNAKPDEMAKAVAALKSPVMIDVVFAFEEDQPHLDPKLLNAWLGDLARWPDLPAGQDLLFLLRFGYRETAAPSRLQFWKKSPSRRVAELLAQVTARPPAGLAVVELPRLASIPRDDIRPWIEDYARAFACGVVGAERDSLFCERLTEKALELFRASPSLPMRELAPKLYDQLRECLRLQQGGV